MSCRFWFWNPNVNQTKKKRFRWVKELIRIRDFSNSNSKNKCSIGKFICIYYYFNSLTESKNLPYWIAAIYKDFSLRCKTVEVDLLRNRKSHATFSTKLTPIRDLNWISLVIRAHIYHRDTIFCLNSELQTIIPDLLRGLEELGIVN